MRKPSRPDNRVTINVEFIREQARDAVHQFFRPITAPFEHAKSDGPSRKSGASHKD